MATILAWLTGTVTGPLGWLVSLILNFFWGKATTAIKKEVAQEKSEAQIDEQKNAAVKEEQDAKTKSELDHADDDLMRQL